MVYCNELITGWRAKSEGRDTSTGCPG